VTLQVLANGLALLLDHHLLAVHEVLDRQPLAQRVVDTVQATLAQPREVQSRLAEGLGRDGSCVDR
jgi:hypothetical protein